MLVEVRDALFGYGNRPVVRVDHLALHPGRCLGVFGPNGAGKTTLIRGVTGLLPPLAGTVERGSPPTAGTVVAHRRAAASVRFAYMPQQRAMDLHWPMTGLDAASMAASARRRFGWMGKATARVREMMDLLGVGDLARRPFAKLSGGQQQRLLLAGAMASEPQVLVLDEPTDGLDVRSTRTLLDLLRNFTAMGLCTVIISHEVEDLLYVCDEVAWLHAADVPAEPSTVTVISPTVMAERMTRSRRDA
jgi:ABC-type Mn2+/Zn2+ transport system ATPase subunit